METYYLIDYENVGSDGLAGCEKLKSTDHILIFFTKNAKKIDMSEIANHGKSNLEMIEVPTGKQSADIHISSYLGYLAGVNKGKDCHIVIVSKDTDFDNIINFWINKTGIKVSRAQKINTSIQKTATPRQSATTKKANTKVDGTRKTKLNMEVMQAVRAAGFEASVANSVAQLVTGLYGKEHIAMEVHNTLREKYTNYLEVYNAIKPVIAKYDKISTQTCSSSGKDKTTLNTEIMRLLSKAGYTNDIVTFASSTVVKNMDVKNGKQQAYRTLISKYGQDQGLGIYNQIKKYI